jgi:hypothetical protein
MVSKCNALTTTGKPCRSKPLAGRPYCMSHDPAFADRRYEGQCKGGEARANARRVAKQWAAIGEQLTPADLPAILRSCMFSVKAGHLEPLQAQAIAALAKTSVSIANDIELEERLAALEAAAGVNQPSNGIRRVK